MHSVEEEAVKGIADNLKREGDRGRNIVEVAFSLMGDGYDKNWVRMALQHVAVNYGISGKELSDYLMIEAGKAQESSS